MGRQWQGCVEIDVSSQQHPFQKSGSGVEPGERLSDHSMTNDLSIWHSCDDDDYNDQKRI